MRVRKIALVVLGAPVCFVLAALTVLYFGNPQWHWRLYAFQAGNTENGILEPTGGFSGRWRNWDNGGKLLSFYNYKDGKKNGGYVVYAPDGTVSSEGQYADGVLDGIQKMFHEDGSRTEIPFARGVRQGVETTWFASGEVAIEAPWENGVQQGIVTFYHESGARQAALPYYNGKLEGMFNTWYENGGLQSEEAYRDGELNGRSVFRSPDGKETMALNYRNGRLDGLQMWFHPNGVKARETIILNGVPDGHWREWDENGELTADEEYENGELKKKAGDEDAGAGG
ncbi:MAG: toxin-antitoxin system YwqK family antitoxin [Planctomycetota bacterium]|jgi:antitoxin component YwqK of YwqJK toxin-antitoxin module|nr:toxin-antitoxin system YwqK family antitoxin [Planctomycetota bacterium]